LNKAARPYDTCYRSVFSLLKGKPVGAELLVTEAELQSSHLTLSAFPRWWSISMVVLGLPARQAPALLAVDLGRPGSSRHVYKADDGGGSPCVNIRALTRPPGQLRPAPRGLPGAARHEPAPAPLPCAERADPGPIPGPRPTKTSVLDDARHGRRREVLLARAWPRWRRRVGLCARRAPLTAGRPLDHVPAATKLRELLRRRKPVSTARARRSGRPERRRLAHELGRRTSLAPSNERSTAPSAPALTGESPSEGCGHAGKCPQLGARREPRGQRAGESSASVLLSGVKHA
jgi:hypothetical protein